MNQSICPVCWKPYEVGPVTRWLHFNCSRRAGWNLTELLLPRDFSLPVGESEDC